MIKIINDFFDKETYDKVIYHIKNKIPFSQRWYNDTKITDRATKNYYGDRFSLSYDLDLLNTFKIQIEKKFNTRIKKIWHDSGIDLRNLEEFRSHTDDNIAKMNCLIMLDGPIGVTTGTCFYTDNELDVHVGFRPNRAVLFPSDHVHAPHACKLKNIRRYTASIFIQEYEDPEINLKPVSPAIVSKTPLKEIKF